MVEYQPEPAAAGGGVEVDAAGVVAFTRELVRVRSVYEPATGGSEQAAARLVEARMRSFGWAPELVEVAPGRPNVLARVEGGGGAGPTLMFAGHTDVVTEGDPAGWGVEPYGGQVRDGRLYGRGSADMKAGLAGMLYATRALQLAGPFPGTVVLAALVDEEGMMSGAKAVAASPWVGGVDGVIVGEPEAGEVCAVAKGALRLQIRLTGAMAHGAMPQHGRNPLPVVARVLLAVEDLQAQLHAAYGEHEHLGSTYLTPTVLAAGSPESINVIPAVATVCLDVRTLPGCDHGELVGRVEALATQAGEGAGIAAAVDVVDDRPAVDTPLDAPVVLALAAAHEAVTGEPARYGGVPGATDGTILSRDAGLATVVYGPGGKWIAHQADEYVEVDEIVRCTRVYAEAARRFLIGGAGGPCPR